MKILEILRLSEKGMPQRSIAASAGCGKSTVGDIIKRCKDKGLTAETAANMTAEAIQTLLYPTSVAPVIHEPDWKAIHSELAKHPNLNLQFMWEEYRTQYPNGLSYGRFCAHSRAYREAAGREVTFVKERKAGDIMEVDWIGDTLDCVVDPESGEVQTAHFFVAILGYSHYLYVEAFPNEQEQNWITAHVNAFHYYGGVPKQVVPDNTKTAVTTPRYYEPVINSSYWELAQHYGVAIVPARSRKPRDKAVVEQNAGWLETWLLGKLRGQQFFSFAELNKAIRKLIAELLAKPFQKRPGSRYSEFIAIDKPALAALPVYKFEIADVKQKKVASNYHVDYDGFYYSVPYTLYGETVSLRATNKTIEVLDKDRIRVASHIRQYAAGKGRYVTNEAHMPLNHRAMRLLGQFDGERYLNWAEKIGENTYFVINRILTGYKVEQQGYKSCMGILQCAKRYSNAQLEEACAYARQIGSCTYTTIKNYFSKVRPTSASQQSVPEHENIRGGAYYR
jgi:transposase